MILLGVSEFAWTIEGANGPGMKKRSADAGLRPAMGGQLEAPNIRCGKATLALLLAPAPGAFRPP